MTNLLEQAINSNDGERAAKLIQNAHGRLKEQSSGSGGVRQWHWGTRAKRR